MHILQSGKTFLFPQLISRLILAGGENFIFISIWRMSGKNTNADLMNVK